MKRVLIGNEPTRLANYRIAEPQSSWQHLKADPFLGGKEAYGDCRQQLISDQGGLCAYCEIDIRDNDSLKSRVEHFHPKSDVTVVHNWALDWDNLLGVCAGGSYPYNSEQGHYLHPTAENLSCDAHKDQMIQTGKLPNQCEGWILNPNQLAAFPSLFKLDMSSGKLIPNAVTCTASLPFSDNEHGTVEALVEHTISMLNLNCDRLNQARISIIRDIEHNKKKQRAAGLTPQQGMTKLAQRYFSVHWHGFFTTIRHCLGPTAEAYLATIHFQG